MHARSASAPVSMLILAVVLAVGATAHPPGEAAPELDARTAELVAFLEDRLEDHPDDTVALSKLGSTWLGAARRSAAHVHYDRAAATFRQLLSIDEGSTTGRVGLAYALIGRHCFTEALELAREAWFAAPEEPQLLALLLDVHLALGQVAEAEAFSSKLLDTGLTLESLSRSALVAADRGRHDLAETRFREAIQAGVMLQAAPSDLAWCETMLGDLLCSRGRIDDAVLAYERALDLDPAAHAASAHLARILSEDGAHEEARRRLEAVVRDQPEPKNWIALADVLDRMGRGEEARRWRDRARRDMEHDVAHGDLGHARELVELWLDRGVRVDDAAELALRDLREVRQDLGAFSTAAWALLHAGRTDEALAHIRTALRRGGAADARVLARAAAIHDAADRPGESSLLRRRAMQIDPRVLTR